MTSPIPIPEQVLVKANEEINEEKMQIIEEAGIERVVIRSGLTCRATDRSLLSLLWP